MTRPASAALRTFLDDWDPLTPAATCDLYTFTLDGGEVIRFSGYQKAVSAPEPATTAPMVYFPLGPALKRNSTQVQIGVHVDELVIEVLANDEELVLANGNITWQEALRFGLFDGAHCDLWRCFMSPPGTVKGTLRWFYGRVADVEIGRTRNVIHVKSLLDMLTVQMPRRLFQAACNHIFGGEMCGFDRTTMAQTITAEVGSNRAQIFYTGPDPDPDTLFNNGTITGTSGGNDTYRRTINQLVDGVIYLLDPWIFSVAEGDTFEILPGCPHTYEACDETFNNADRYGGFRWVPPPETAV